MKRTGSERRPKISLFARFSAYAFGAAAAVAVALPASVAAANDRPAASRDGSSRARVRAEAERAVAEFRASALEIPSLLLAQGVPTVGDLDLAEFVRAARGVEVRAEREVVTESGPGMTRRSGRWSRGEGAPAIAFDPAMWGATYPEARPLVSLHEFLGAAGFDDADYRASIALWILSRDSWREALGERFARELAAVVRRAETPPFQVAGPGGGIVGVGGGGDFMGVYYKAAAVRDRMERLASAPAGPWRDREFPVLMLVVRDMSIEIGWRPIAR